MRHNSRWVPLDGAVNVRDLGGLPTSSGGTTQFRRVLRSDNLLDLTDADVAYLIAAVGVREVVDLRSDIEVRQTGLGPLGAVTGISVHHHSLFRETSPSEASADLSKALPWHAREEAGTAPEDPVIGRYLNYLAERPESIVAAVRQVAHATAATVVSCAAGKDRTGVVCALMLEAVGVTREAVVADYIQTGERIDAILERLRGSDLYAADVRSRPPSTAVPRPQFMDRLLTVLDERHDGARGWLEKNGWTSIDQSALLSRLVG